LPEIRKVRISDVQVRDHFVEQAFSNPPPPTKLEGNLNELLSDILLRIVLL
jgi:hypothetical protein